VFYCATLFDDRLIKNIIVIFFGVLNLEGFYEENGIVLSFLTLVGK
jgi:hypothetical protein